MLKKCVKYQPSWQCKMYTLPKHQTRPDHLSIFFFFSLSLTSPTYTTTQALLNIFFPIYTYFHTFSANSFFSLSLHIIQLTLFFCKILSLSRFCVLYAVQQMDGEFWMEQKQEKKYSHFFVHFTSRVTSECGELHAPALYIYYPRYKYFHILYL